MNTSLFNLYTFCNKNKLLSAVIGITLFLFLGYFATRISFQENINQLIPSNEQSSVTSKVLDQVNFADKITIIVSSEKAGSPDYLTNYANAFIDSLKSSSSPFIKKIQGKNN